LHKLNNKTIVFISFVAFYNSTFAQKYPWKNKCENEKSEAEIGVCVDASCKEATKYFENQYNELFKKINADYKKAEPNSIQSGILAKYIKYLPILKKALTDNAVSISEIESAPNIGGSGEGIIRSEILLSKIESNIATLAKIKAELPSFE
jgi:hypothetical protein